MNKVIIFAYFVACIFASRGQIPKSDTLTAFKRFKKQYGKRYTSIEQEMVRFSIFVENLQRIDSSNQNDSAIYGVTQFSDLTELEFIQSFTGFDSSPSNVTPNFTIEATGLTAPASFNWVKQGVVTPVKQQGSCGSCWAFSVTGAIEGQYVISLNKPLTSFSEQQLIDCNIKNQRGCKGGKMDTAFEFLQTHKLETEESYPYVGRKNDCVYQFELGVIGTTGFVKVSTDEDVIASTLVQVGPLSISINANPLQQYLKGILDPKRCLNDNLNHSVLLVGYGTENNIPYWLVKNSWGTKWGEHGYFRITRGKGTCGINKAVSYPTLT